MEGVTNRDASGFAPLGNQFKGALQDKRIFIAMMEVASGGAARSDLNRQHDGVLRGVVAQACAKKRLGRHSAGLSPCDRRRQTGHKGSKRDGEHSGKFAGSVRHGFTFSFKCYRIGDGPRAVFVCTVCRTGQSTAAGQSSVGLAAATALLGATTNDVARCASHSPCRPWQNCTLTDTTCPRARTRRCRPPLRIWRVRGSRPALPRLESAGSRYTPCRSSYGRPRACWQAQVSSCPKALPAGRTWRPASRHCTR